jgi:hypothetical protein
VPLIHQGSHEEGPEGGGRKLCYHHSQQFVTQPITRLGPAEPGEPSALLPGSWSPKQLPCNLPARGFVGGVGRQLAIPTGSGRWHFVIKHVGARYSTCLISALRNTVIGILVLFPFLRVCLIFLIFLSTWVGKEAV